MLNPAPWPHLEEQHPAPLGSAGGRSSCSVRRRPQDFVQGRQWAGCDQPFIGTTDEPDMGAIVGKACRSGKNLATYGLRSIGWRRL